MGNFFGVTFWVGGGTKLIDFVFRNSRSGDSGPWKWGGCGGWGGPSCYHPELIEKWRVRRDLINEQKAFITSHKNYWFPISIIDTQKGLVHTGQESFCYVCNKISRFHWPGFDYPDRLQLRNRAQFHAGSQDYFV